MIIPEGVKHIDFYRAVQKCNGKIRIKSRYKHVHMCVAKDRKIIYWRSQIVINKKCYTKNFEFSNIGEDRARDFIEDIKRQILK